MVVRQAVITAAVVTLASLPRLALSGWGLSAAGLFMLPLLVLVADAPAAWGTRAGMGGLLPDRRRFVLGLLWALGAAVVIVPLHIATDPGYRLALAASARPDLAQWAFPIGPGRVVAAMLWAAGFEALFFYGFVMSVMARATGGAKLAVAAAVLVRTVLSLAKLLDAGLLPASLPALGAGVATSACLALLFLRGGLPAVSLLALLVKARHLLAW